MQEILKYVALFNLIPISLGLYNKCISGTSQSFSVCSTTVWFDMPDSNCQFTCAEKTNNHTGSVTPAVNLRSSINLTCTSLDRGRKPEYFERWAECEGDFCTFFLVTGLSSNVYHFHCCLYVRTQETVYTSIEEHWTLKLHLTPGLRSSLPVSHGNGLRLSTHGFTDKC